MTASLDRPSAPFSRETAPPFLTFDEAALTLGVSPATISDAVRAGTLTAVAVTPKTPRIPREALWSDLAPEPLTFEDRRVLVLLRDALIATVVAGAAAATATKRAADAQRLIADAVALIEQTGTRASGSHVKRSAAA